VTSPESPCWQAESKWSPARVTKLALESVDCDRPRSPDLGLHAIQLSDPRLASPNRRPATLSASLLLLAQHTK
jgi:hypothetical protein